MESSFETICMRIEEFCFDFENMLMIIDFCCRLILTWFSVLHAFVNAFIVYGLPMYCQAYDNAHLNDGYLNLCSMLVDTC